MDELDTLLTKYETACKNGIEEDIQGLRYAIRTQFERDMDEIIHGFALTAEQALSQRVNLLLDTVTAQFRQKTNAEDFLGAIEEERARWMSEA